jgi:phospholipid/cholesterol/gamma-HCH transport system substrate-binding protein
MENRAHALAAGLFTIVLGAALIIAVMWFNKDDVKLDRYDIVTTQSVSGLKVEAAVRFRGVEVGRVTAIRIEPGIGGRIRIEIGVTSHTPITKATYAQLGYQGVTGLAFVTLNDTGTSKDFLLRTENEVPQLPLRASLLDNGEDLLGSVSEIAGRVNTLLGDENQKLVRRTLAGLEKATQRTADLADQLAPGVRSIPALVSDTRGAVQKADALLANLNALTSRIDEKIEVLTRVANTVDEVGVTARSVNDETLPRLNALVDELSRETRALDRLLSTIGDHPQSIVFGAPPRRPGPGEPGFGAGASK